jgi:hypothetical protein
MFVEAIILSLFLISPLPTQAEQEEDQASKWENLGEVKLGRDKTKAVINVPLKARSVQGIWFKVEEAGVEFGTVTVFFRQGSKEFYRLNESVDVDEETRVIALPRPRNALRTVNFTYEFTDDSSERAIVKLLGR